MATLATISPHWVVLHQDRHQAPTHPFIHPLSLQDREMHIPDGDWTCSVGTRGGRVEGRGPCACPCCHPLRAKAMTQTSRTPTRTGTRPPPIPSSTPCPYRTVRCTLPMVIGRV